jgi:polyhydroxyalkanoate synthase
MDTRTRITPAPSTEPAAVHPTELPAVHPLERAASAWLGHIAADKPELEAHWAGLDRFGHAMLASLTNGMSPASLVQASTDWALHLALAPGKQGQLVEKMVSKALRWWLYTYHAVRPQCGHCIEPLPQDRRFADPAWDAWPYNVLYQGFLLTQQWWHVATTGVPGVTPHHEQMANFAARQWLDRVAPSNFIATNPVVQRETRQRGGANLWDGWLNALDDWRRAVEGAQPAGAEAYEVGRNLAVTPGRVVLRNRLIELIQYEPTTSQVYAEPILIVPAWIMKYYILDLSAHNSLVKYLVDQGHTVFMISWKNPDANDRDLGMDDYLRLGVFAALDAIGSIRPDAPVHLAGYCLGGTLAAIAAAALARQQPARLSSLTLLAAQTDFEDPGEISLFIDDSQVTFLEDLMSLRGTLDAKQMAGAFQMLRSNDLIWSYRLNNYLLGRRAPMNDLMAWNADPTRMPYRMHSEYLRQLFLDNQLAEARYRVDDRPVALTDIRAPIFAVGTLADHVAPWRSVYKIHLLSDAEVTFALTSGGHNAGIVSEPGHAKRSFQLLTRQAHDAHLDPDSWLHTAPRFDGSWWPAWESWLRKRASKRVPPPPIRLAELGSPPLGDAPGRYVLVP